MQLMPRVPWVLAAVGFVGKCQADLRKNGLCWDRDLQRTIRTEDCEHDCCVNDSCGSSGECAAFHTIWIIAICIAIFCCCLFIVLIILWKTKKCCYKPKKQTTVVEGPTTREMTYPPPYRPTPQQGYAYPPPQQQPVVGVPVGSPRPPQDNYFPPPKRADR